MINENSGEIMRSSKGKEKKSFKSPFINFAYENSSYQIDPEKGKVYQRWIEIERAKEFTILSAWRNSQQMA